VVVEIRVNCGDIVKRQKVFAGSIESVIQAFTTRLAFLLFGAALGNHSSKLLVSRTIFLLLFCHEFV